MHAAHGNTKLARRLVWLTGLADAWFLLMTACVAVSVGSGVISFLLLLLGVNITVAWYAISQGVLFEYRMERRFKAVCLGLGFSGEARSFRNGIRGALRGETKIITPKLRQVHGTYDAWTGVVIPFAGQTVASYNRNAEAFKLAFFNVPFVAFEPTGTGLIRIRCGAVPVPQVYEYQPYGVYQAQATSQLPRSYQPAYQPVQTCQAYHLPRVVDQRAVLQAVPLATDINGNVWTLPIEGQHLLIAGRAGSGKGSWIWSLVFNLAEARRAGIVRFYGCDPKRIELAMGMQWWDEYADTTEGIIELLEKAVQEMFERTAQLKGVARKFTPSQETPLNVIIIDELAYVSSMISDKKLAARAENAIKTILVLGRAVGYSLVGAAQDPRKETLGFRDHFPYRVALGIEAPMVDLILGEGMHDAGAACEMIPKGDAGAGCGYVMSDYDYRPLLVRAAWCSDEAIKARLAVPFDSRLSSSGTVPQPGCDGQPLQQWQ